MPDICIYTMKGLVVILIAVIVLSSILAAANLNVNSNKKNKNSEFNTFTSAVCETKGNQIYCEDKLFMNCNGILSEVNKKIDCNGIKFEAPRVTGNVVFEK